MIRTQDCILRYLSKLGRAKIVDVGGGAGVYSFWLASLGHDVHLIDLVPLHIMQVQQFSAEKQIPLASISIGDAKQRSPILHRCWMDSFGNSLTILILFALWTVT